MGLFYRRINPIFFPRQRGNVSTSTIGNLQLAISFATDETFEWNFYFVLGLFITNAYRADTRLTLLQSPRAWREAERIMALSRYTYLYVTLLPALFLRPLLTSSAADCTRKWRERLDYNYISQACILHTCKILPVQRVILDFYPRIFYTASDSRAKLFFKMFASMSPPPWRTKAFRNIGRDILSRSLVLKRKVLLPKSYSNGMAKFGSCRYFL